MKIQSKTNPEIFYEVSKESCTCPDFVYRRQASEKCKHMKEVP